MDLTWSGATSANIDVYRNGVVIATMPNDGSYTDSTGDHGRATYTYKVCEAGTPTCSSEVTVRFGGPAAIGGTTRELLSTRRRVSGAAFLLLALHMALSFNGKR